MTMFVGAESRCLRRQGYISVALLQFDWLLHGPVVLWRELVMNRGSLCCRATQRRRFWVLTGVEAMRALRFLPAASFWSRCASLSARSFSIPCSLYHWVYSPRLSAAAESFSALIVSVWWACRWPLELMWVKRWEISENRCLLGQAIQMRGIEPSGFPAPEAPTIVAAGAELVISSV
jgi:hypothetical protein